MWYDINSIRVGSGVSPNCPNIHCIETWPQHQPNKLTLSQEVIHIVSCAMNFIKFMKVHCIIGDKRCGYTCQWCHTVVKSTQGCSQLRQDGCLKRGSALKISCYNFCAYCINCQNTACQECWVVKYHAWVDFPSLCHCSCDMTKCTYFRTAEAGSGMGMGLCFLAIGGMGTALCSCNAKGFSDALIFKTSG